LKLAKETKFVQRECRKITPNEFFDLCLFSNANIDEITLNSMTTSFQIDTKKEISNQSLNERFNEHSVEFLKALMKLLLCKIVDSTKDEIGVELDFFETVRIKDSTCFQISDNLISKYAASNKKECKLSIIRIQFEYDLKTGQIYDLAIQASSQQDKTDAQHTIENINENDLLIIDLGYFVIRVLAAINSKRAYFLSRFDFHNNAYETEEGKETIDFVKIQSKLKKNNLQCFEKKVFIGQKERFAVRMIIELLPDDEIEKRLRKLKQKESRKGVQYSAKLKSRISLNVYITNIPAEILPIEKVRNLYRLRWQIELVFKVWKSIGKINLIKDVKLERFETMFYARLILILLYWLIFTRIKNNLWHYEKKYLSMIKTFKTLIDNTKEIKLAIKQGFTVVKELIQTFIEIICKKDILSKKKNNMQSIEIMILFMSKKNKKSEKI
jgi:hypothetical protein